MKLLSIFSALIFTSSLYSMEEEPWGDKEMKNLQNFRNEHPDIDGVIAREFLGFKGDLNDAQEDAINGFKSLSLEQINIMEKQVIPTMKKTFPTTTQAHYYTILGNSNFSLFKKNMNTLRKIKRTKNISSDELRDLRKVTKGNRVFFKSIQGSIPSAGTVDLSRQDRFNLAPKEMGPMIGQSFLSGALVGIGVAAVTLVSIVPTNDLSIIARRPDTVGTSLLVGGLGGGVAGVIYTMGVGKGHNYYRQWLKPAGNVSRDDIKFEL